MTTFTVTPIKNEVRVHTGLSKDVKKRIEAMSKETKIAQSVIINSMLAQALKLK